jgi:FkbM family methyltransferase
MLKNDKRGLCIRPSTSDLYVLNEVFDEDVYGIENILSSPSVVLDIGGNIGAFSYRMAKTFPTCQITTIEPEPDNFSVLIKNCEQFENVTLINKAVWSDSKGVNLIADCGGSAVTNIEGSFFVESISFNELLEQFEFIDFLKIDVEGAEVDIILSATPESMRKIKYIVGEFHGDDARWGDWVRYLGAFFNLNIIPHEYPNHPYGGMFYGVAR